MLKINKDGSRVVDLILKRDPSKDYKKENINYFGLDIHWADGEATSVKFAHFCTTGIGTIFGIKKDVGLDNTEQINKMIPAGEYEVKFFYIPVEEEATAKSNVKGSFKVRRMYALKEDGKVTFYFRRGIPTIMIFSAEDEERVLQWIDFENIPEGTKVWFDFAATLTKKGFFGKFMTKIATLFMKYIKKRKHDVPEQSSKV